jgi:hypothetical protein
MVDSVSTQGEHAIISVVQSAAIEVAYREVG